MLYFIKNLGENGAYIEEKDIKHNATIGDMIECGFSGDDLDISCVDEEKELWQDNYEKKPVSYEEICNIELDDYFYVSYWDGNNWQNEVYRYDEIETINNYEINEDYESRPNPCFYFIYDIIIEDEIIKCSQSNCSGSLSPFYFVD